MARAPSPAYEGACAPQSPTLKSKELASCLASSRLPFYFLTSNVTASGTRERRGPWPWRRRRSNSRCGCSRWRDRCRGSRSRRCGRTRRRCPARTHRAIEDLNRANYGCAVAGIAACRPDVVGAVGVRGEVATSVHKGLTNRPAIAQRIIDVHFVGGSGETQVTGHDPHLVAEVKPPRISCCPRYAGNGGDRISHRVIDKGIGLIDKR